MPRKSWDGGRPGGYRKAETQRRVESEVRVVNVPGDPQETLETCTAEGEMENRIKEQQLGLFADRNELPSVPGNQFRLLLSSRRTCWCRRLRRTALAGTELAPGQVGRSG